MLSTIINSARTNPRTTLAGLAKLLLGLGSIFGTMHTGQVWPIAFGVGLYIVGDFIQAALAGDGKTEAEDVARLVAIVAKVIASGKTDPASVAATVTKVLAEMKGGAS